MFSCHIGYRCILMPHCMLRTLERRISKQSWHIICAAKPQAKDADRQTEWFRQFVATAAN